MNTESNLRHSTVIQRLGRDRCISKIINRKVAYRSSWIIKTSFAASVFLYSICAAANVKYFVLAYAGQLPKYPTGADACIVQKDLVQSSADEVSPGGSTVVVQWPDENTVPNLKNMTSCVVNWSRTVNGQASSWDYTYFIVAGLCDPGQILDPISRQCVGYSVSTLSLIQPQCNSCIENYLKDPINPATGAMFNTMPDMTASTLVSFNRFYNSTDAGNVDVSGGWRHNYSRSVAIKYSTVETQTYLASANTSSQYADPATACTSGFAEIRSKVPNWVGATALYSSGNCQLSKNGVSIGSITVNSSGGTFAPAPTPVAYDVIRDDGQLIRFIIDGNGAIVLPPGISLKIQKTVSGFTVTDSNDNIEQYDPYGKLLSITSRNGVVETMSYDTSGRLSGVRDSFGHQLTFSYDTQGRLMMVTRQ